MTEHPPTILLPIEHPPPRPWWRPVLRAVVRGALAPFRFVHRQSGGLDNRAIAGRMAAGIVGLAGAALVFGPAVLVAPLLVAAGFVVLTAVALLVGGAVGGVLALGLGRLFVGRLLTTYLASVPWTVMFVAWLDYMAPAMAGPGAAAGPPALALTLRGIRFLAILNLVPASIAAFAWESPEWFGVHRNDA